MNQPRRIQLKHAHGPISIIVEFMPAMEQLRMQGLNTDFYNKVIPYILRKIPISRTFFFAENKENTADATVEIILK